MLYRGTPDSMRGLSNHALSQERRGVGSELHPTTAALLREVFCSNPWRKTVTQGLMSSRCIA